MLHLKRQIIAEFVSGLLESHGVSYRVCGDCKRTGNKLIINTRGAFITQLQVDLED